MSSHCKIDRWNNKLCISPVTKKTKVIQTIPDHPIATCCNTVCTYILKCHTSYLSKTVQLQKHCFLVLYQLESTTYPELLGRLRNMFLLEHHLTWARDKGVARDRWYLITLSYLDASTSLILTSIAPLSLQQSGKVSVTQLFTIMGYQQACILLKKKIEKKNRKVLVTLNTGREFTKLTKYLIAAVKTNKPRLY